MSNVPESYKDAIIHGDAFELAKRIPSESIDMILCDPVYWDMSHYSWVAALAERVLVDGGNVVVQCGIEFRYQVETVFRESTLQPHPLICEVSTGGNVKLWAHRSFGCWRPYVWFSKGEKRNGEWIRDMIRGGGRAKGLHEWGDSLSIFVNLIERLCPVGGIVCDPFCGSGSVPAACKTVGRHWVGFEIDEETAIIAQLRVVDTPRPLFVVEPSQIELGIGVDDE